MHKRKIKLILSALFLLFLTGCTPEEKTLLLPSVSSSGEESEEADSAKDFTVKKIYTYTYDTSGALEKSAFLRNCGENEIRILARDEQKGADSLIYRQVDYRYGFYDTLGELTHPWEDWLGPSEDEMEGELYIEQILPSPDGSRLLLDVRSSFWNTRFLWLYSMGSRELLLLYEDAPTKDFSGKNAENAAGNAVELLGSFSESGRWVTFDATGAACGAEYFIPIYDCEKEHSDGSEPLLDTSADSEQIHLCPPDQKLYPARKDPDSLYTAALYDRPDSAGLISFGRDYDGLFITQEYSDAPNTAAASEAYSDPCTRKSAILEGDVGSPYLHYKYHLKEDRIYYLTNPISLSHIDMSSLTAAEATLDFPNLVWDFLPLDSGDLLVVLVQELKTEDIMRRSDNFIDTYVIPDNSRLAFLQDYWDILSADLYLYPEGETEGHLLYKNLQNLVSMEYDASTRRILLETRDGQSLSYRKCIILEL